MIDLVTVALVFVGGASGSAIRWLAGLGVGERRKGGTFPLGTFLINVSGAFVMGFLSTLFYVDWKDRHGSHLTAFMLTGVLGGYTTFSSYQLDTANLYNSGKRGWALYYCVGSVVAGLIAAALGAVTAKLFRQTGRLIMLGDGFLVFMGGGIGAAVRELLMVAVADLPGGFPMPIFIANMAAALLIGALSALAVPGGVIGSGGKLLLTTGIMGGLSTFSSFIWATDQMVFNPAEQTGAIVYLVLSMVVGFLLVVTGLWLGGRLRSRVERAATGLP